MGISCAADACDGGIPALAYMGAAAGDITGAAFGMTGAYLPPTSAYGSAQFAGAGQVSATSMHDSCRATCVAKHDMHHMRQPVFRLATCHIA